MVLPTDRFGRSKTDARATATASRTSRYEVKRCRRRQRHLEQIMARICRGGERTAGRTGFSWVGLGWVGITSAIDLITPYGPRCLLVPSPLCFSFSLARCWLFLSLSSPYRFPSGEPSVFVVTLSLSISLGRSASSIPRVSPLASSSACFRQPASLLSLRALPVSISLLLSAVSSSRAAFLPLSPLIASSRSALHPRTFLFLFLLPRADLPLALFIYQARGIRVALWPRARRR